MTESLKIFITSALFPICSVAKSTRKMGIKWLTTCLSSFIAIKEPSIPGKSTTVTLSLII